MSGATCSDSAMPPAATDRERADGDVREQRDRGRRQDERDELYEACERADVTRAPRLHRSAD